MDGVSTSLKGGSSIIRPAALGEGPSEEPGPDGIRRRQGKDGVSCSHVLGLATGFCLLDNSLSEYFKPLWAIPVELRGS